jgi:aspartate kinase
MSLLVLKFGGSSVANTGRIRHVAELISEQIYKKHKIVVVTSAMYGVTSQLIELTKSFTSSTFDREYDTVISTGEQVAAGLLALCLNSINIKSKSFNAWQLPIIIDGDFSNASINSINKDRIFNELDQGVVPVITGFQGISLTGDIFTIGRGGSDATACAVAYAINADKCLIYTDVDGVYTADPRIVLRSKRLSHISYDEMIELTSNGAQVLQAKSVIIAKQYHIKLNVLSSFIDKSSETIITDRTSYISTAGKIAGIAHNLNALVVVITSKFDMQYLLNKTKYLELKAIDEARGLFICSKNIQSELKSILDPICKFEFDSDIGVVTITGRNICSDIKIEEEITNYLEENHIKIKHIYGNALSKSFVVPFQYTIPTTQLLHAKFFE